MGQRIRKLMLTHKALHSRYDVNGRYMSRKEEGRGVASIKDGVDTSIRRLEDDITKSKERLFTVTTNSTGRVKINRTTITRKPKWEEKQLYGYFKRQTDEISHEKIWMWLRMWTITRLWISSNSSKKQCHKDQLCQSENR